MTRQFALFAAQIAVITASVTAILYVLKVPESSLKRTIALGVGVLALSALFLAVCKFARGGRAPDPAKRAPQRPRQAP